MNKLSLLMFALVLASPVAAHAEGGAGKVGYMSGALIAQRTDGTIKVMVPKSEILEGDVLVTAKESYAQVVMNDGTRMTLRPNSNLKIETYQFNKDAPQADSAVFRLLKGGFRTVTGLIGKRGNADAYKLRSAGTTIGVRGTEFTSRLCATQNCADEGDAAKLVKPAAEPAKAVGRVMLLQGEMAAKESSGKFRKLTLGSPVFEGDTLQSSAKSTGVVVFRDGGRITLQENSVFVVEQFKYDKAVAQENVALRLLKGSVRVVTGLIGRLNHDNYKFSVSGATIGVRGTGFDAWCNGPCAEGAGNFGATQGNPLDGAGVFVWAGEVVLVAPGGSFVVAVNQAAIIARETGKPVAVVAIPAGITGNSAPRPDSVPVDMEKLFNESSSSGEPGLYVTVHDGLVVISKGDIKVDLGKGESGFSNEKVITRLANLPDFMGRDLKLENIDKHSGTRSSMNQNGCVVGQ